MKIIISPTKTMKHKDYDLKESKPLFLEKSLYLRSILKTYDLDKIKKEFKTSDNLSKKILEFYQSPKKEIQALNLYEGLAFKNMHIESWTKSEIDFVNDHLIILSAMYGALRPSDMICEYRLDYVMKFEENLYDFWQESLYNLFKEVKTIVNLASQEFSKGISHHNVINIIFLDKKGRNMSTQAKIGRGDMLNFIVKNKIKNPNDLKKYNNLDYKFLETKSDDNNYYFQKF